VLLRQWLWREKVSSLNNFASYAPKFVAHAPKNVKNMETIWSIASYARKFVVGVLMYVEEWRDKH
jgi:hypothetical protein